ncbi:MAG TPA: type II secretion system F family protein [Gaiellaceae bacterium]|nr:type II secretion system F family protein [Gaiellaceae bacterium]
MLLVLGLLLCAVSVVIAIQAAMRPRAARQETLRRAKHYTGVGFDGARAPRQERESFFEVVVPVLSRIAMRVTPRVQRDELQSRLAAAGLAPQVSAQQFLAMKTVLGFVVFLLAFAVAGFNARGFLLSLVLIGAAVVAPDFILRRAAFSRAERVTADLPEAIDQIVVSLEAGLSFDAAVSFYVRRGNSPLARELRIFLSELRMGEGRSEALRRLSERVPSPDMRNFVQVLLQSEGVGMSRAGVLSAQASDLRHRRQMAAEERAHKAPVKMLFPLLIFIMPVMFVVILGPALQQATRLLGK